MSMFDKVSGIALLVALWILYLTQALTGVFQTACYIAGVVLSARAIWVGYDMLKAVTVETDKDDFGVGLFCQIKQRYGISGIAALYGNLSLAFALVVGPRVFGIV